MISNCIYKVCAATMTLCGMSCLLSCSSDKPDNLEPRLQTLPATGISRTEATLDGKCYVADGTEMPQLWFSYGTDESMAQKSKLLDATDGNVQLVLMGLTAGTTYYYSLQGGNGTAVLSGETLSLATMPNDKPTVGSVEVLSSSPMSIIVGYSIASDGGDPVTESGCYLSRQDGGDMGDGTGKQRRIVQTDSYVDAYGRLHLRIDGLQQNIAYTIKPFAANINGESTGEAVMFATSSATVVDEAGQLALLVGDSKYSYSDISLAGPLNGDDLRTLRDMAGRDDEDNATQGQLADIDMSGVRIVSGGGVYAASRYSADGVVGTGLFASCSNLRHIVLPQEAVSLEKDALKDCASLHSIDVSASMSAVVPSAGCTSLEDIRVSAGNTHYCSSDGVLMSGDGKSILWFPVGKSGDYTLPATVTAVGEYAFRDCSIGKFVFADGLKKIGQCAFYNSKVREVVLPSTLLQVPTGTFQKCTSLTTVRMGANTELIGEYAFDGCPLADIYITATMPPVCYAKTFATSGSDFVKTCRLHVPKGRKPYYRANSLWGKFENIIDDL